MSVGVFLHIDTSLTLTGDVIQQTSVCCLVLAEIKGCQVRDLIVGKWGTRISQILYGTYANEG